MRLVGWHHQLDGREFEQTPEDCEAQGSLVCCSPWGCKESDTTEGLNNNSFQRNEGSPTVYWTVRDWSTCPPGPAEAH